MDGSVFDKKSWRNFFSHYGSTVKTTYKKIGA